MAEYGKAQAQISVKGAPRKPRAASGRAVVKKPAVPKAASMASILQKIL